MRVNLGEAFTQSSQLIASSNTLERTHQTSSFKRKIERAFFLSCVPSFQKLWFWPKTERERELFPKACNIEVASSQANGWCFQRMCGRKVRQSLSFSNVRQKNCHEAVVKWCRLYSSLILSKNTKKCSQSLVQFNFGKTTLLLEKLWETKVKI
jgi:hypothetical protein